MRWHIKRTKLLFALIPIISIVFYVFTSNHNIFADQSFVAFDIYQQICDTRPRDEGKTPADYSAEENFAIAAGVYAAAENVSSTTSGTISAMGFYKQTVLNTRIKTGGHLFCESISLSAIASVAEQRYFKDRALLYRAGEAKGGEVKGWSDTITELSVSSYRQRYGVVPQEICKYSVTAESVESGSFLRENEDGTRTYELIMNAAEAQKYSRYEMMTFAGVTAYPDFLSCRLVFTIDDDWRIRTLESFDTYKIDMMGGITCESGLTEAYTFDDVAMPDRAQPFIDYVPTGNTGELNGSKGPADYLDAAFAAYITGGAPLCLTADVSILGDLPVIARLDIQNSDFRFAVGDNLFAAYTPNGLFVQAGARKYKLAASDLSALGLDVSKLGISGDVLGTLFENHSIEETDTHVFIRMPFSLFGLDLDVTMGLRKTDDGVVADTIRANVGYGGISTDVDVIICADVVLPDLVPETYVDLQPLVHAVQTTLRDEAWEISGNVAATVNGAALQADITAHLQKQADAWAADGDVSAYGVRLPFVFADDTLYVRAGGTGIKAQLSDLPVLLDIAQQNGLELPQAPQLPKEPLQILQLLNTLVPQYLPGDLGVSTLIDLLACVDYNGNALQLAVTPKAGAPWSLTLTHDERIRTLALNGLRYQNYAADLSLKLDSGAVRAVTPQGEYSDVADLPAFLPTVQELLAAQSYTLTLTYEKISVTAEINRDLQSARATVTYAGETAELLYADQTVYLRAGDFAGKIAADALSEIAAQFGILPEDITALLPALPQPNELPLQDILSALALSWTDDTLTANVSYNGYAATVVCTKEASGIRAHISLTVKDAPYEINAYLTPHAEPLPIAPDPEPDYTDLQPLGEWISPVREAMGTTQWAFALSGNITIERNGKPASEPFAANVSLRTDAFAVGGTFTISGQSFDFAYMDNTAYLSTGAGKLAVKSTVKGATDLASAFRPLLDSLPAFLQSAGVDTQKFTAVLEQMNAAIAGGTGDLLSSVLPSLDFRSITALLGKAEISARTIALPVTTANKEQYRITVQNDGARIASASVRGLTVQNVTVDLMLTRTDDFAIPEIDESDFTDIADLAKLAPALEDLLGAQAFELAIDGGTVNTAFLSGEIAQSGNVQLSLAPLRVQADLTLRTHKIFFFYSEVAEGDYQANTFYVAVNNIRLRFTLNDIAYLKEEVRAALGQAEEESTPDVPTVKNAITAATLLQDMLGGKTLADLLNCLTYFGADGDGYSVGLSVKDASFVATVAAAQNGLSLRVTGLSYADYLYDSSLYAELRPIAALTAPAPEADTFVSLRELGGYLRPVLDTAEQKHITLTFGGTVLASNGEKTEIRDGGLQIARTQFFADIACRFTLTGKTGTHTVKLWITDGTAEGATQFDADACAAYIEYNGMPAQIDYRAAVGIVRALVKILDIEVPYLDKLPGEAVQLPETDVFSFMNVAGLDGLRDTLDKVFRPLESVSDATSGNGLSGLTVLLNEKVIDTALHGVEIAMRDGVLHVLLDNGMFAAVNKGKTATVTISHQDGLLHEVDISRLMAQGNTVSFRAQASYTAFDRPQPFDGATDLNVRNFSGLEPLLFDLVNTASLRQFEISGTANVTMDLRVFKLDTDIPLHALVKILPDGSTVAAIKLTVNDFGANLGFLGDYRLFASDSYIYYADEMLYFIVDEFSGKGDKRAYTGVSNRYSATVQDFLAHPMEYLLTLIRMSDGITSQLTNAGGVHFDLQNVLTDIGNVLKKFDCTDNTFTLKLGLAELLGSKDFSDLNLQIVSQNGCIAGLHLDTRIINLVDIALDASITNFGADENGTAYAKELSGVSFGRENNEGGKLAPLSLSGKIDDLTSDLSRIFPVEYAETQAAAANKAATAAINAIDDITDAQTDLTAAKARLDDAAAEYATAQEKLEKLKEGMFGYERARDRAAYAAKALDRAQKEYDKALDCRTAAANDALTAAQNAFTAAQIAASAAQAALDRDKTLDHGGISVQENGVTVQVGAITDTRAYTAAGTAAQATVGALNAVSDALDAVQTIAEETKDDALLEAVTALRDQIENDTPAVAKSAANAAIYACDILRAGAQTAADAANSHAESGEWTQAATSASQTLSAVAALKTATKAATQAAALSEDETLQARAQENATAAQQTAEQCAATAASAATNAATHFADESNAYVAALKENVKANNADAITDNLEKALVSAQSAAIASRSATTAAQQSANKEVSALAALAAENARTAVSSVGDYGANAAHTAMQLYADSLKTVSAPNTDTVQNAANTLSKAQRLLLAAERARDLNAQENAAQTLADTHTYAMQVVQNALRTYGKATESLAGNNASEIQTVSAKVTEERGYSGWLKGSRYEKIKELAPQVQTGANNTSQIAKAAQTLLQNARSLYESIDPSALTDLTALLGNDTEGWIYAYNILKNNAQQIKSTAEDLLSYSKSQIVSSGEHRNLSEAAVTDAEQSITDVNGLYNAIADLAQLFSEYAQISVAA